MRRQSLRRTRSELHRLLGAVAAVIAIMLGASAAQAAGWHSCSGAYNLQGQYRTIDFWRFIRVRNTTCRIGHGVAQRYVKRTHGSPGSLFGERVHIWNYVCTGRLIQTADNPYGQVICTASRGRRVTFKGVS